MSSCGVSTPAGVGVRKKRASSTGTMLEILSLPILRGSRWGQSHSGPLRVPPPSSPGLPFSAGHLLPWLVKNITRPLPLEAIASGATPPPLQISQASQSPCPGRQGPSVDLRPCWVRGICPQVLQCPQEGTAPYAGTLTLANSSDISVQGLSATHFLPSCFWESPKTLSSWKENQHFESKNSLCPSPQSKTGFLEIPLHTPEPLARLWPPGKPY